MIVWLNGAFGAGKTQTAYELRRRLPGTFVYDPENIGYFLRKNLPPGLADSGDFQDLPLWRQFNYELLSHIAENHPGPILVPMTIVDRGYYDELVARLAQTYPVTHIILCARRETLERRLRSRLEGRRSWAALQIDRCLRAFDRDIPGIKLATDGLPIAQVAEHAARAAGLALEPDRRGPVRRGLDRLTTQLRHIR